MEITVSMIKDLREKTGAGMMDCKNVLTESGGDMEKAMDLLRQKGLATAKKRAGRDTKDGQIHSYIHSGDKLGVLVEVNCETDFVAKTDQFQDLTHNLALHIAASSPLCVDRESVPGAVLEKEKAILKAQALDSGKPENIVEKIVEGRLKKFYSEVCLLEQPYVKNPELTVQDMINDVIAKLGENVNIRRFVRFQLGEELEG